MGKLIPGKAHLSSQEYETLGRAVQESGDVKEVQRVLNQYPKGECDLVEYGQTNLYSPLHHAAEQGFVDIVKALVEEFGADPDIEFRTVNEAAYSTYTPLYVAVEQGNTEVVRTLCELGAEVDAKRGVFGMAPTLAAARLNHVDILRILLGEFKGDPNVKNRSKQTPLHLASENGNIEVVRLLVNEYGADVSSQNDSGRTPLHNAALTGNVETVRALIKEFGAEVNSHATLVQNIGMGMRMTSGEGEVPLHLAVLKKHMKVVELLVEECGADVSATANGGKTPISLISGDDEDSKQMLEYLQKFEPPTS